jgi:hypothetical protein
LKLLYYKLDTNFLHNVIVAHFREFCLFWILVSQQPGNMSRSEIYVAIRLFELIIFWRKNLKKIEFRIAKGRWSNWGVFVCYSDDLCFYSTIPFLLLHLRRILVVYLNLVFPTSSLTVWYLPRADQHTFNVEGSVDKLFGGICIFGYQASNKQSPLHLWMHHKSTLQLIN